MTPEAHSAVPYSPDEVSQMTKLLNSSKTSDDGAVFKLDSGEVCFVSVTQSSWVLVKSAGWRGLFSNLYNQMDRFKVTRTAAALDSLFLERRIPIIFRNHILSAFANAIWHCSTAAEVSQVLNTTQIYALQPDHDLNDFQNAMGPSLRALTKYREEHGATG